MNRPIWLMDVPSKEYFEAAKSGEYLTSHKLNEFRRCPMEYRKRLDGEIVDKDTPAFMLGRATHAYVLEGQERFDEEFVVSDGPVNPKTCKPFGKATKEFSKWREMVENGEMKADGTLVNETDGRKKVSIVGSEDFEMIRKMREAVFGHDVAKGLLCDGIAEGTVRRHWIGEPVQCRMDWFNPETGDIVDLKTCADVDKFRYDIKDHGYLFQLAFYARCVELSGYEKPVRCWIVAVEKKEPYRVCVVRISEATIEESNVMRMANETLNEANEPMIAELVACRKYGKWPTRYEEIVTV